MLAHCIANEVNGLNEWAPLVGVNTCARLATGELIIFPPWLAHSVGSSCAASASDGPRISVSFNVRVTFPDDEDEGGFISPEARANSPPKLSFVVPGHHQKEFLDDKLSKDMQVQ